MSCRENISTQMLTGSLVQVNMRIWVPANLAVAVDDPTLNQIVPSLDGISSTCTTPLYQKTAVYATCDFVGGGTAISGVDVTSLVTFTSASSSVEIINNYVQVQCQNVRLFMGLSCIICTCTAVLFKISMHASNHRIRCSPSSQFRA